MTNEEFKKTLWDTANKLRDSVSAAGSFPARPHALRVSRGPEFLQ